MVVNKLVSIEGLRGSGKTTLVERINKEFNYILTSSFPSKELKNPDRIKMVDWNDLSDIVEYNQAFITDFLIRQNQYPFHNELRIDKVVLDRYILSNLAHYRFDIVENGFSEKWDGISQQLYALYNSGLIKKPDIQIFIYGHTYQPVEKFDDSKYKEKSLSLKRYYDLEIDNLLKYCGVKTVFIKGFQPEDGTFNQVVDTLKSLEMVTL